MNNQATDRISCICIVNVVLSMLLKLVQRNGQIDDHIWHAKVSLGEWRGLQVVAHTITKRGRGMMDLDRRQAVHCVAFLM